MDRTQSIALLMQKDGLAKMPPKKLPPDSKFHLWLLTCEAARHEGVPTPSWRTFKRAFRPWRKVLKRHKANLYVKCNVCFEWLATSKRTSNVEKKAQMLPDYSSHIKRTSADESVYYALQNSSVRRELAAQLICGNMDRATWPWPCKSKSPKSWSTFVRQIITTTGIITYVFSHRF